MALEYVRFIHKEKILNSKPLFESFSIEKRELLESKISLFYPNFLQPKFTYLDLVAPSRAAPKISPRLAPLSVEPYSFIAF